MTDLDRRQLMRGLVAAAVSAQLPSLDKPKAEALVDLITDDLADRFKVTNAGRPPARLVVRDIDRKGWFLVQAEFPYSADGSFDLSFAEMNGDSKGLWIGGAAHPPPEGEIGVYAAQLERNAETRMLTFSCYVKPNWQRG